MLICWTLKFNICMMTLLEAIPLRHSVRKYKDEPLPENIVDALEKKITELNGRGKLHMQLVLNEPKAFTGILSYGKFYGVRDYVVVAGSKSAELDEKAGYYGEELVLYAQTLGLNTCWVGLSYRKIADTFTLNPGEKVVCYIAIGYGEIQGVAHKTKSIEELSNVSDMTPAWFKAGVEAARLAPTAINQQKFYFRYIAPKQGEKPKVAAERKFSMVGYTQIDLGIAKRNFEIAAGASNFEWA